METCPSGWRSTPGKCVYGKLYRGFESLSLRMNPEPAVYYVYVLESLKDHSFYIGQCDCLDKRMSKHFDGMSRYTASKRPLRLRYFEVLPTRSDAIKRERQIKGYKSRKYIQSLIDNWAMFVSCGWRSPDTSGESVYTGNCIVPLFGTNPSVSAEKLL